MFRTSPGLDRNFNNSFGLGRAWDKILICLLVRARAAILTSLSGRARPEILILLRIGWDSDLIGRAEVAAMRAEPGQKNLAFADL